MSALLASHPTAAAQVEQDLKAARERHGKTWSADGPGGRHG